LRKLLAALALASVTGGASAQQALMFGHQNFDTGPTELYNDFEGITHVLAKALNQRVRFESVKNVGTYLERAAERRYAVMFAPPNMVMEAHKTAGCDPIAKIPGRLAPAFFTLTSARIAFVEDMQGKRLGTTGKDSLMALLGMLHLRSQGVDPDKYFSEVRHFADVNAVIFALTNNMIDVGLASTTLFNVWTNRGHDLALIDQAQGAPHLIFGVRSDLSAAEKRAILQVLLGARQDPDASTYFRKTGFPGLEPARLSDYGALLKRPGIS
jgi:ABC-type phosphate/phosphonate transport system substrate-binding protein